MFTKYIAVLFLCISNLILIGHDIVPHKHAALKTQIEPAHHAMLGHHHNHSPLHHHAPVTDDQNSGEHDEEHSPLSDLFAHVTHTGSYLPKTEIAYSESLVANALPNCFFQYQTESSSTELNFSLIQRQQFRLFQALYTSPTCFSTGLRAPPVILA